jgi:hypothetical protein
VCVCLFAFSCCLSTIKLHAEGTITCKTHSTIQCSQTLKYSILNSMPSVVVVDILVQNQDHVIFALVHQLVC